MAIRFAIVMCVADGWEQCVRQNVNLHFIKNKEMNRSPDLVLVVVVAFVVGTVMTGFFSQSDLQIASLVAQVLSRQG